MARLLRRLGLSPQRPLYRAYQQNRRRWRAWNAETYPQLQAEAAQANSDRPEQGEWWAETAKLIDGEATFHDSTSVIEDLAGDPGDAGFVQVMQGRGSDPDRARELMTEDSGAWRDFRPDILGTLSLQHDGDGWTMAIWLVSCARTRTLRWTMSSTSTAPPRKVSMARRSAADRGLTVASRSTKIR